MGEGSLSPFFSLTLPSMTILRITDFLIRSDQIEAVDLVDNEVIIWSVGQTSDENPYLIPLDTNTAARTAFNRFHDDWVRSITTNA